MNPRNYILTDDNELLQNFYADKDNTWLGILLQRYTLLLFGVCMKYFKDEEAAKDGVQQVFLKVLNELPKHQVTYFKGWLYMVAKNHCLMKLRKKSNYTFGLDEKQFNGLRDELPDEQPQKEIELDKMAVALLQLNDEQRQCITLFFLQKKSYQQISETTGFNIMQVKSHIQNGKRNLKINMERPKQHE
ncbi:MAG: sigma-70 family RNA polymerase sigma factor [Ferruginibacter sp.]